MSSILSSASSATQTATATPSCISVVPDKNGYVPEYACNSNYNYYPSFGAAVFFSIVFGITTFAHIYQAFFHKKLRLSWTVIMGATWEFASFSIRAAGSRNQQSVPLAFVSQILVLLAPMWVNAFLYMVMGRMIYFFVLERKVWGIEGTKIAKLFVWLDILSFLTQVGGGVMISPGSDPTTMSTGIHVYMGGIGLQQACVVVFTGIAVQFHLTLNKQERENQILDGKPRNWRKLLYVLYASLALITTRVIFRMVEFASGLDPTKNPIPYHEAYFYVLDGFPMLVACVLLNIVHPGTVLQGPGSEFPRMSRKEKKAAKAEKKDAKRLAKEEKRAAKEEKRMQKKSGLSLV